MPVSCFCGIRIRMDLGESEPPHFIAEYRQPKAMVDIEEGKVIHGSLPDRQLRLVLRWNEINKDQLRQNWELLLEGLEPNRIEPL